MIVRRGGGRFLRCGPAVVSLLPPLPRKVLVVLVLVVLMGRSSRAAESVLEVPTLDPWILLPSSPVTVVVSGKNLESVTGLWTSFPAEISGMARVSNDTTTFQITPRLTNQAAIGLWSTEGTNGRGEDRLAGFDSIPTVAAAPDRTVRTNAQDLVGPIAVDARFTALKSDWYRVSVQAGEEWVIEVVSRRINSPADPFLRIYDPQGHLVTFVEDTPGLGGDVRWRLIALETGDYQVEVRDSAWGGGVGHRYRVRVSHEKWDGLEHWWLPECCRPELPIAEEIEPNNSKSEAQVIPTIPGRVRGRFSNPGDRDTYRLAPGLDGWVTVLGRTRSLGSPAELRLRWRDSSGKIVAESGMTEGDEGRLIHRLQKDESMSLEVLELNGGGGAEHRYELEWLQGSPVGVTATVHHLVCAPGKTIDLKLKVQAGEFKGRLTLSVEGIPAVLAPGEIGTERESAVTLKLPESIPSGTTHWFRIGVRGDLGQASFTNSVETLFGWRKLWSHGLTPPGRLDGWFRLDVR